jgi:hypothetical protein
MHALWRTGGATVAAAALLVVGADYATFSATGDSLILGRANSADRTTTLTTKGSGPALSLQSRRAAPSLRVSSQAKVARLNADQLDGRDAAALATRAVTYRAGQRGDVVTGGFGAWELGTAPGRYLATFKAVATPTTSPGDPPVTLICGVVDLNTIGPRTRVYTADSGTYIGDLPVATSGAEMVRIKPFHNPGLICATNGVDFTLFKSATASLTPINARSVQVAVPAKPPVLDQNDLGLSVN